MKRIYISTDAFEAEALIDPDETKGYKYTDISIKRGKLLKTHIEFNPMVCVELNDSASDTILESIATDLVKRGLFVATEESNGGTIRRLYFPAKRETRDELVKISLQKQTNSDPAFRGYGALSDSRALSILKYSNKI